MALKSRRFADNARLQQAAQNRPAMRPGETGKAVEILQQALIDLHDSAVGSLPISTRRHGRPDGIYGDETSKAVGDFQAKYGLQKDGHAGRETLGKLDELFAEPAGQHVRFAELFPDSGFDGAVSPPWLMVPLGQFKVIRLQNGDGLELVSDNMGVAQAEFGLAKGKVAVFGRSQGKTLITARMPGGPVKAELDVSVHRRKIVSTAFFFVRDLRERMPKRPMSSVPQVLAAMNRVYTPQTNVQFVLHSPPRRLDIMADLGDVVGLPDTEKQFDVINRAARNLSPGADYRVIFVWEVQTSEVGSRDINGVTKIGGDWSIVEDDASEITVAHEAGHHLGVGGNTRVSGLLMYCSQKRTGVKIPKEHAQTMNANRF